MGSSRLAYHLDGLPDHDVIGAADLLQELGVDRWIVRPTRRMLSEIQPGDAGSALADWATVGRRFAQTIWDSGTGGFARIGGAKAGTGDPCQLLDTDENAAARAGEWLATIIEAALPERDLVVVSSGPAPAGSQTEQSLERLARILQPLAQRAASRGVRLALRPAHGNFIATFAHFLRWQRWCDAGTAVACVADLDAMALQGELPLLTRFELLGKALGGVWAEYFAHPNLADPIVTRHALPWTAIAGSLHEAKFDGPVCLRLIGPPERAIAHALRIREAVEPAFRAEQSG